MAARNPIHAAQAPSGSLRLCDRRRFRRGLGRGDLVADAECRPDLGLDLAGDLGVLGQELLGVVAALAETRLAVGEEGARLADDVVLDAEVQQLAFARDPLAVLDLELGLAEGRRAPCS